MQYPTAPYQLWNTVAASYTDASWETTARRFVVAATLAANAHNTQPWAFSIADHAITIRPDWTRHLTVSDPTGRQLFLSIGAALENLLITARADGHHPTVILIRQPAEKNPHDLNITVTFNVTDSTVDEHIKHLATAIPNRRSCRHIFDTTSNQSSLRAIQSRSDGVTVSTQTTFIDDDHIKRSIADLAAAATRDAFSQKPFRTELSQWIRNNFTTQGDGMPAFSNGVPDIPSLLGPTLIRFVNIGPKQATDEHAWMTSSDLLAVISTQNDDPASWIAAGQTLERLMLQANVLGLSSSIIESPIEVSKYRPQLTKIITDAPQITDYRLPVTDYSFTQVLMRFGSCAKPHHPTPRRPVSEVIR